MSDVAAEHRVLSCFVVGAVVRKAEYKLPALARGGGRSAVGSSRG